MLGDATTATGAGLFAGALVEVVCGLADDGELKLLPGETDEDCALPLLLLVLPEAFPLALL